MSWDYGTEEDFSPSVSARSTLFIVCEGNFQYGNASLSAYDPATLSVENNIFLRANGMKLGDVAQSMTIHNDTAWIVVNNSHVIFAIDPQTYRELGRITGLPSPRYIHFVSDTKAYVTQLWDNRIFIINPRTFSVTGHITIPGMDAATGSTEQMVRLGNYIYVNCWSYQNRILRIDTRTDAVVGQLEIGPQPNSMVLDKYERLWVITDGSYRNGESVDSDGRPALHCVNTSTFSVEFSFPMYAGDEPRALSINAGADTLYWINNHVWQMPVEATRLPFRPFIRSTESLFYSLFPAQDNSGEIYVSDAIDYQQAATIMRFNSSAQLIDRFSVGITPAGFCWYQNRTTNSSTNLLPSDADGSYPSR